MLWDEIDFTLSALLVCIPSIKPVHVSETHKFQSVNIQNKTQKSVSGQNSLDCETLPALLIHTTQLALTYTAQPTFVEMNIYKTYLFSSKFLF